MLSTTTRSSAREPKETDHNMVEPINLVLPGCHPSPERVVITIGTDPCPARRRVVLTGEYLQRRPASAPAVHAQQVSGVPLPDGEVSARSHHRSWLIVIERVLGGWAPTLRVALILAITLAGLIAVIVIGFGIPGALLLASAATAASDFPPADNLEVVTGALFGSSGG
jgi:hypothetical protein